LKNKEKNTASYNGINNKIIDLEYTINELETCEDIDGLIRIYLRKENQKNINYILKRLLLYKAYKGFNEYRGQYLCASSAINYKSINEIKETVNHVLAEEYLKVLNKNQKEKIDRNKIIDLMDINALKSAIPKEIKTNKKEEIFIKASRGLLMEFAAFFSDTCMTSQSLLAKKHPWLTSLIFIQKPNSQRDKKLVGSCFIIEAKDEDGDKVLVIRANNLLENTINQLSVEDFMDKLLQYIEEVAKEKDINQIALALDNHNAGATTNREKIFNYLDEKYNNNKIIKLDGPYNVNYYDLQNPTIKIVLIKTLNS
jgi:hypothetical protein